MNRVATITYIQNKILLPIRYEVSAQPHTVREVRDSNSNDMHLLEWDANGNLQYYYFRSPEMERWHCWDEDNRLQATSDNHYTAFYQYGADGNRALKLSGESQQMSNNGNYHYFAQHYFEGGHRVCTAVGGGFGGVDWSEVEEQVPAVSGSYGRMHEMQDEGVNKAFEGCFGVGASVKGVYNLPAILEKQERWRNVAEPLHFYHGDHLGSAAYLTDRDGHVVQTLAYLPYGEDWVEQNGLGDTSRLGMYRYNGKERDGESGYLYYGARYYWSELWNGWLSVDPMEDKYPGVSPYNYCAWNPVVFVDPEGKDGVKIVDKKSKTVTVKANYYVTTIPIHNQPNTAYTVDDVEEMNQEINSILNSKQYTYNYNGETYDVVFDLRFISSGASYEAEELSEKDIYGNSFSKSSEALSPRLFPININEDGTETHRGGITEQNKRISMNHKYDNPRRKIHEIFHTLFYSNDGAEDGIGNYNPGTDMPNQNDIDILLGNPKLPTEYK